MGCLMIITAGVINICTVSQIRAASVFTCSDDAFGYKATWNNNAVCLTRKDYERVIKHIKKRGGDHE